MSPAQARAQSTRLLVSVRDPAEAALAADCGADLVDAKDPDRGALGALPPGMVAALAAAVRTNPNSPLVSAVAGELRGVAELASSLGALAPAGADLLKVALPAGIWGEPDILPPALAPAGAPVIAVFFAEDGPEPSILPSVARAGFAGAMIDTRIKDGTGLPDLLPPERLAGFVAGCREAGLISGLAGSLRIADIAALAHHGPSYLGFRGGLCANSNRGLALDGVRIREAAARLAETGRREAA